MTDKINQCTSCKVDVFNLKGSTEFICPNCSMNTIVRCRNCRKLATKYKCKKCGFTGPN